MIIWLIIWLIIWWLFVIIRLWLFDNCDEYLMIIWWLFSIIWWLFGDYSVIIRRLFDDYSILDYLMLIWCLFDDYLQFSFVQAHGCAHSSAAAIWACLHCGLQTIGNLKPGAGGDGEADTESSTGLGFGACRCAGFAAAGRSAWSRAMNANQWLGGTLSSCLLLKACCGSYRQKWENGQQRTWT